MGENSFTRVMKNDSRPVRIALQEPIFLVVNTYLSPLNVEKGMENALKFVGLMNITSRKLM